jgi:endonuclease/exonuclease/phosphatase (EEP) superfamily protein YafD
LSRTKSSWATPLCMAAIAGGMFGLVLARLGHLWPGFDVFSQFSLHFAMLVAASTLGLLLPRWKLQSAFSIFAAFVLAYGAWPHPQSLARASDKLLRAGEEMIKVASFNVWLPNSQPEAVKAEIQRLDPDVMVLVEVGRQTEKVLIELKNSYPYQYLCTQEPMCHLAIISKFPLRDASFKVGWRGPPMIRATLGGQANGLTVVGVHTTRFPHSRAQLAQADALAQELSGATGALVVMGDVNATPYSRVTQTLEALGNLTRLTNLPTWPSGWGLPQISIDHIFVGPGIRALSDQVVGRSSGSDHYPIAMALGIDRLTHPAAQTIGLVRAK